MSRISKRIKPGAVLGEKYSIVRALEKGGMGTVFEAVHTGLDRKVAVKVLHPSLTENKRLVTRFVQEAKMIAMVHQRNIVDVLDVGYTSHGVPFFVMEFLNGRSLKTLLRDTPSLPVDEAVWILKDTLMGLSYAHDKGIIHRDMKPGNIFLANEPDGSHVAKILDFGISKLLTQEEKKDEEGENTLTGAFLGTPAYMSPEQAKGKHEEVDTRADIYSCGVIMYKMLTGMTPFKGDTFVEVLNNVIHAPVPPPSFIKAGIPGEVDMLVMKAMSREPSERFQDCGEFIDALDGLKPSSSDERTMDSEQGERSVQGVLVPPGKAAAEISVTQDGPVIKALDAASGKWSITAEASPVIPEEVRKENPWKKRLPWLIPVAVLVAAVPAATFLIGHYLSGPEKKILQPSIDGHAPQKILKNPASAPPDPAIDPVDPGTVNLAFTGFPAGSEILVDGKLQEKNPVTLEKGSKLVTILVMHNGKELLYKVIKPEKDVELFFSVEEVAGGGSGQKATGDTGKKKKKKKGGSKPTIFKNPVF